MDIKDFDAVLQKHVRLCIIPQMRNPLTIFAIGGALGAKIISAETLRPQLELAGILHGNDIDTERLRDFVAGGFSVSPTVKIFGITFDRNDAESLLRAYGLSWPDPVAAPQVESAATPAGTPAP